MRKSINGLAAIVEGSFKLDLFGGNYHSVTFITEPLVVTGGNGIKKLVGHKWHVMHVLPQHCMHRENERHVKFSRIMHRKKAELIWGVGMYDIDIP